jgi:hypothetical protein
MHCLVSCFHKPLVLAALWSPLMQPLALAKITCRLPSAEPPSSASTLATCRSFAIYARTAVLLAARRPWWDGRSYVCSHQKLKASYSYISAGTPEILHSLTRSPNIQIDTTVLFRCSTRSCFCRSSVRLSSPRLRMKRVVGLLVVMS